MRPFGRLSRSAIVELQLEYEVSATRILKSTRLELEKIVEENFSEKEVEKLEEIAGLRVFWKEEDREWYYKGAWPKMKKLFEEHKEEQQAKLNELYSVALKKMLAELPPDKQKEWREKAGEFVQFPTPTLPLIEQAGRFKYGRTISY